VASLPQVAVIGAIVATLFCVPAAIALGSALALFGVSVDPLVTFGGALGTFSGLFAWWLIAFAAACVYSVCAFPWREQVLAWPKKK
jgi:hypothetical protein